MDRSMYNIISNYEIQILKVKKTIIKRNNGILLELLDKTNENNKVIGNTILEVINTWSAILDKFNNKAFSSFQFNDIINWYDNLLVDIRKNKLDGHNFNIFDLFEDELNIKICETMHSKLIKYLLDVNGSHGQGDQFLIQFLKLIGIKAPECGIWHISAEKGKIDILLRRTEPESIVIVENKSNWAKDQSNQLYRYWYNAIFTKTAKLDSNFYKRNKDKYKILYLVPNRRKQYNSQSISKPNDLFYSGLPDRIPMEIETLTYDGFIKKWLSSCIDILPTTNYRVREYITQYQYFCNKL